MDKTTTETIVAAAQLLIIFFGGLVAVYKGVMAISEENTRRKQIEEENKTKRVEVEARENSLGREALIMLKEEIKELKEARDESGFKFKTIESAISKMEFIIEFIEKRLMSQFPETKK